MLFYLVWQLIIFFLLLLVFQSAEKLVLRTGLQKSLLQFALKVKVVVLVIVTPYL
jgi:hypothetical protein